MRFQVIAFGDDGKVFRGEDLDLSDAISQMSQCVIEAGTPEDWALLTIAMNELRKVASEMPEDYFGTTYQVDIGDL